MRLLLLDNNDSFTFNIVDLLRSFDDLDFDVIKSEAVQVEMLRQYDKFIISPGPGKPSDFPMINETIKYCINNEKDLLGICLGHQAICEFFGGELFRLESVVHGQKKKIEIDTSSLIYNDMPKEVEVGLYHSWAVNGNNLPECLMPTGFSTDKTLMSIQHRNLHIFGVQFHPESFLTTCGNKILQNFIDL